MNGIFDECDLGEDNFTYIFVENFDPPPLGSSKDEDFDPVVHLEIANEEEVEELKEDNQQINLQ